MMVLLRCILLVAIALASKEQRDKRFLSTSSNVTLLEEAAVKARSLQAIDWNSWKEISSDIGKQTWKWQDKDGSKTDLTVYKYMAKGFFTLMSDISSGKSWDVTFLDVAETMMPLISMANPLLGLTLGVLFSFFGGSSQSTAEAIKEAMQSLYKQIMSEVSQLFQQQIVESQLLNVQEKLATTMSQLAQMPAYLAAFNASTCKANFTVEECKILDSAAKFDFWTAREGDLKNLVNDVFGHECVNQAVTGPKANPGPICRKFQEQAPFVFQFPFAVTHLQIIMEIGKLLPTTTLSNNWLCWARHMAGVYYRLLKDSFEYFRDTGGNKITSLCNYTMTPYCDRKGGMYEACVFNAQISHNLDALAACNSCDANLKKASCNWWGSCSIPHPMTGNKLPLNCKTSVREDFRLNKKNKPIPFRNLDLCKSGWAGACTQTYFEKLGSEWERQLNDSYQPVLLNISDASKVETEGFMCLDTHPSDHNPYRSQADLIQDAKGNVI